MRIDKSKCKKILGEVPLSCKGLINKLKTCSEAELVTTLKDITSWEYGKCELFHWIDVLDRFDSILERVAKPDTTTTQPKETMIYLCRRLEEKQSKHLVYYVLYFTALLMEHAYARHLYSSIEHLTNLLAASDMDIVLAVLNLLYVFSKRSAFISRLTPERRSSLKLRLNHLAESWGGKDNGFGLASCCEDKPLTEFPSTATTLHFEFYIQSSNGASIHKVIHMEHLDAYSESSGKIQAISARVMEELVTNYQVPTGKQMGLLTHIRLAQAFSNYTRRLQCVQARLQAISILVYSNAGNDILQNLLYDGLIEELVDVLGVTDPRLTDIKAAALRTLTAIIHLERTPRINAIIDATGMSSYHGFFPSLFRSCVLAMIGESQETPLPQTLSTALFSFLYHLASYESGGEALVSCGIMETLLRIVQWKSMDNSQLTFVTRAVRLVDLITNMDITTFTNFSGLTCLISRLEQEVNKCREILGEGSIMSPTHSYEEEEVPLEEKKAEDPVSIDNIDIAMTPDEQQQPPTVSAIVAELQRTSDVNMTEEIPGPSEKGPAKPSRSICITQRAALLKSILNFLKKSIPDPVFSDYIRNVMDGSLPSSLKHIISKAEYYGPSLFLLATEVVTLYVFHEPSLLSSLQDRKLTDVILEALVVKEVPPTREVIASLPNILSALCLNQRGLEAFIKCKPFDRLFHVLLSPQYLPAMRRRSSDSLGDTATNLGTAMDELMRHQPTLRQDAMTAIIKLLKEVCVMGEDENVIVQNMSISGDISDSPQWKGDVSDEDDDLVVRRSKETLTAAAGGESSNKSGSSSNGSTSPTKQTLPLMEYVYNVVRFIDAILSNNATDDHCKEFVKQGGLEPLIKIPSLPNIAIQFASSRACMDVAITLKDILTLSQDGTVIVQCFNQIDALITQLQPLYKTTAESCLVNELTSSPTPTQPFNCGKTTPLLHTITSLESYTTLLINLCKVGQRNFQVDMRTVCIAKWGSEQGLEIISKLSKLFTVVVWECNLLALLCPPYSQSAGRGEMERLIQVIGPNPVIKLKGKERKDKSPPHIRLIKPLWQAVDRLKKHLAAFLIVLCKLSCGHTRVRRTMGNRPVPSSHQCDIAKQIIKFIVNGLSWRAPDIPEVHSRVSLMAMVDHIGLAGQILYSESQQPYHLMLLEFDRAQGLQALVGTYEWSAGLAKQDNMDLVPGSGEFMMAWLSIIKKLIDVKQVTESSHSLPTQTVPPSNNFKQFDFEPLHFLAKSHKFAFEVTSQLWEELYTYSGMKTLKNEIGPITESVIVILKHLLKGDLQEKLQKLEKKNEDGAGSSSNSESTLQASEHLVQHLMDMGFARQHAVEALVHSNNNLTAATEYVLTRPSLSIPMPDSDMSEEEAMMQAIAMSLSVEEESSEPGPGQPPEEQEEEEEKEEIEYVTEDKLWSLYDKILAGCIKLLEDVPSAVFKIGDLLAVIMDRKGDQSRSDTISRILPLVVEGVKHVIECLTESAYSSQNNNKRIAVLGAYLHCLLLISEDLMFSCGELFSEKSLFDGHLITLLRLYTNHLIKEGSTDSKPPGWLTPLILLFDVYEKMATMVKRRKSLPSVEHIWQYYEERHNRWVNYPTASNTTLEKAYIAGEPEVCFNNGRRHYMVLFNIMTQINEENGAPRPVMRIPKPGNKTEPTFGLFTEETAAEAAPTSSTEEKEKEKEKKEDEEEEEKEEMEVDQEPTMQTVEHFSDSQVSDIVVLCTKILGHIQDSDAVQALLRLLLRFTRNHKYAQLFAENNGLHHIMHIKVGSAFTGFSSLSALIFRHLLEDEDTLRSTISNTVLGYLSGAVADESTETRSGHGNIKEIHNIIQKLAPVASRSEPLFVEACKKFLRFTVPANLKESDFNDLSSVLKEPYVIKASSEKPEEHSTISPLASMAIQSLLGQLTVLFHTSEENIPKGPERKESSSGTTSQDMVFQEEPAVVNEAVRAPKKRRKTAHTEQKAKPAAPLTVKKYLVTQSAILKMLSEAVKSYSGVAEYIIDQTVLSKEGESVSALTFIMDNLLAAPGKDAPLGREDTHEHAKMILSTIAASSSSEHSKEKLVDQIRMSFVNALNTLESPLKHAKVQAIASLMSIILDPRGPYNTPAANDSFNLSSSISSQSPPYISKLLIAKGLVSDLAQVPYKLDLSSPYMALTINMCLKPLEVLTRLIYSAVLAESSQTTDKTEDSDKPDRGRIEDPASLGDHILNDVVDQLLEGTLPPSSAANILGRDSQEDMDAIDVVSSGRGDARRVDREVGEEEDSPVEDCGTMRNMWDEVDRGGNISGLQNDDNDDDDGDGFTDDEEVDEDDEDDEDEDDEDEDEEEEDEDGHEILEDGHGVDDTVDETDGNMVDEDEGSDMEVDEGSDMDDQEDEDIELEDSSNLVFGNRPDSFNFDFLNDEEAEEQFVAVMNTSRSIGSRTVIRWSSHSPLARARARANGSTSSGLHISHPLLMRNSDLLATTEGTTPGTPGTATATSSRIPRMLDSDTGAPILSRLLNSAVDHAVLLSSARPRNSRVHVFDQVTRDEILNSDLNDFNPGDGLNDVVLRLPSALARWREEAQVLDGSSIQDLVQLIKPSIISCLQSFLDSEVAKLKEVMKEASDKAKKEEAAKKAAEKPEEPEQEPKEQTAETPAGDQEASSKDHEASSTTSEPAPAPAEPRETQDENNPSPSDDLGPLLSSSLNMANNGSTPQSEDLAPPPPPDPTEPPPPEPNDSMPDMFMEDSDSSLTSVGSSVGSGWTPPQSTTDQAGTVGDRQSPTFSSLSETNPPASTASQPTSDVVTSDVIATSAVTTTTTAAITTADVPVSSLLAADTTEEATNETSAQTDTTVNAVYIDGIPVPEGIDPSFLEALPDSIRMEVLLEQSAALERQRRVAAQQRSATEPQDQPSSATERTDAYNPSDVLMSLPTSLRRSVLADMEESQLNSLNEDLVQDYERIRSEQRARQVYTTIPSSGAGTSRTTGSARNLLARLNNLVNYRTFNIGDSRVGGASNRASIGPIFASTVPPFPPVSGLTASGISFKHEIKRSAQLQEEVRKVVKKRPVEHEAITCLLVLLFIDDSLRLQTSRLHRVLRNLCCNTASRTWILISLISIIQKCCAAKKNSKQAKGSNISFTSLMESFSNSWLNLSMNTSLGCKNNVFEVNASAKGILNSQEVIKIHPQASAVVCRRVLDLLVALGRYFPNHFLSKSVLESGLKYQSSKEVAAKKVPQAELLNNGLALTDFWDFLLSSDNVKGKVPSGKTLKVSTTSHFLLCPLGQLMVLLDHPVIKHNQNLIDRLLRLLSSIAHALAEQSSDKKEDLTPKKNKSVEPLPEDCPENSIETSHLQLVTNILTTGACSEEGLEDGTSLLLQLSKVNSKLRDMTLSLMLSGLQAVASDLQLQIKQLLDELKEEHLKNPQKKQQKDPKKATKALTFTPNKGSLKTPHRDLHLPAMSNLTKKNSSQAYFLRILKVVIAVREVTIKSMAEEKERRKKELETKKKEEKEKRRKEREAKEEDEGSDTEEEGEEDRGEATEDDKTCGLGPLSEQLKVSQLWTTLGDCLSELGASSDTHAVLVLQPAVEAFFHVHGLDSTTDKGTNRRGRHTSGSLDLLSESPAPLSVEPVDSVSSLSSGGPGAPATVTSDMSSDTRKFITFAEQHRIVLNQILRQSTTPLSDGPFQVLVNYTRVLDFDVKRRYFRQELDKIEETNRREDIAIRVRREHVFEESFRELHRRSPEELKSRLYVIFEGEEGQDAGGLLREWYQIIAREIFNPHYALFTTTSGDKVTYVCNSFSHYNPNHLDYFKFVGRVIAKAIYDNKHLDCYFSRSFYKHILGQQISFKDMEHEDYSFFKSMMFLLEHDLIEVGLDNLDFTMEIEEFGVTETRDLKPNGQNIPVTNANKREYVKLISQMKMTGSIRSQIKAFLDGFYDIIPRNLISIFSDTELELLISGLPTIDIDDLKANTEYHKYSLTSLQIQWFWRALRSFSQAERANFLQFVTGTSKVPLQGFSSLEGMNGIQKFQIHRDDRSTDRLPSAHTCFNQLDLPVYETYDKLRRNLLLAINECPEGFGLA